MSEQEKKAVEQRLAELKERSEEIMRPRYSGHIDAPEVYSTLEGGMVSTGRELDQCPRCGFWMSDKPSPQEEREHDRQCHWF